MTAGFIDKHGLWTETQRHQAAELKRRLDQEDLKLGRLEDKGFGAMVGVEIEWYLMKVADEHLSEEHIGVPGTRGRPIKTSPVEPGYHYHSESNMDLMQPVLSALGDAFETIGLPLR